MEESAKKMIFGVFLVILGISLFILSFLDKRTYADSDNQTIKDNIDAINMCTYIIMVVSAFIILSGLALIVRSRGQFLEALFQMTSKRFDSYLLIGVSLLILIVGIVQRVKINNILPDMSDSRAVKSYDDHHTVSASSVLGSNMGIIVIGIILLLVGGLQFYVSTETIIIIRTEADIQNEINRQNVEKACGPWNIANGNPSYSKDTQDQLKDACYKAMAAKAKFEQDHNDSLQQSLAKSMAIIQGAKTSSLTSSIKSLPSPVSAKPEEPKPKSSQFNYYQSH